MIMFCRGNEMRYCELPLELLEMMKPYWDKVVSIDLETHVLNEQFLVNERILSISFARRVAGRIFRFKKY